LDRLNQIRLPLDGTYDYKYDGSGVTVFILDTGIRLSHVELSEISVTCGFNAIESENCDDLFGHGTHVAGSVASKTYGVAKKANLVAVKVLDKRGSGSYAGIIAGIDYVMEQKVANPDTPMVINMSINGSTSDSVNEATEQAVNAGIVVVVAAGNSKTDACNSTPAGVEKVITVGASEIQSKFFRENDRRAQYSNYGSCVDIFALGTRVESLSAADDTGTAVMSGTSMASPHVAGAAALYLQKDPTMTPAEVRSAMINDATNYQMMWLYQRQSPNKLLNTKNID
jgi:aqualysin 1